MVDPKAGFTTIDDYADRLLAPKEGWQSLCSGCHGEKTFRETGVRVKERKKRKKKK